MAWEQINGPLGAVRGDYHAAQISAAIYNAMKGKKGKRAKVTDLLIKWDTAAGARQASRAMDPHQMLRTLKRITRTLGGRDLTEPEEVTGVDSRRSANPDRRRSRRR